MRALLSKASPYLLVVTIALALQALFDLAFAWGAS